MPPADYTVITRGGLELAAQSDGPPDGPAVLLLHGGGQTRYSWGAALTAFSQAGYHAISYDARGHGESDWAPDGDYSFQALAEDLVDVAGGLSNPVAVVGASMGGITAYLAEGRAMLDIAALVLVDIAPNPAQRGGNRIAGFMTANRAGFSSLDAAADAVSQFYPERPRPKDVSGLRRNLRYGNDGRLYWHWDPRLFGDGPTAEPPDVSSWAVPMAASIEAPILLIHGDRSDVVDERVIAETRALIPHLEVALIAGAGHMLAGDQNDAFNQRALDFVGRFLPL